MNETLVTILMPCKNGARRFLKEALESIFKQSVSTWKLIVIDDHSEDQNTLAALGNLAKLNDPRIRVLRNESNFVTGALNTGMRKAKTPFVCSVHCDDKLDEKAIEILNRNITENSTIDYFHSSRRHIDESGKFITEVFEARDSFELSDFKIRGMVKHLHCWKVGSALEIGGMDESLGLHGADDYDFPWCMAEAGYTFKAIPECLYYYRDHRHAYRLTTHVPLEKQVIELKKIMKKHDMTNPEIEAEIERRSKSYLKQALFLNEQDKGKKERENYDIREGWRYDFAKPNQ